MKKLSNKIEKAFRRNLILIFVISGTCAFSQHPHQSLSRSIIPNGLSLLSTCNIFTDTLCGSCFIMEDNNIQYIITAKHLFKESTKSDDVKGFRLMTPIGEKAFAERIFFHSNPDIDIAVLKLSKKLSEGDSFNFEKSGSPYIGQDCIFLGFPLFNLGTTVDNYKVPFIKKATFSGGIKSGDIDLLLFDGLNNPGFSGGPIISYDEKLDEQYVVGVVTSYFPTNETIVFKSSNEKDTIVYKSVIQDNSGIMIAVPSKYIKEIVKSIP